MAPAPGRFRIELTFQGNLKELTVDVAFVESAAASVENKTF
jgi:hypothetical protein